MKSKIFIFTTLILVVFLFVITSCDNFLNAKNKTTININLDLSKILKTSRNETTTIPTEYILKVFAYNAATYKPEDEIQNLPLLTQTENKVDINGNVKASLDVAIGLNVIFVAKLYQGKYEKPLYAGKSEVIKIKATDNKVHLVLTRENADLDIDILIHDHTFATEWTSDATHHWHAATCEHTTEVSGKAAHSFGDWTTTKEATEEVEGTREKSCTVCGYKVTEAIAKLDHTHTFATDWTSDETHHWYAATCEHTTEVSDKAAHTFGDWTTTKEATEEAEGTKERSCTVCGYTATEVITKLDHTHKFSDDWTSDDTYHWHSCICGEKQDVAEHSYTSGICECGMREMVLIPAGTFQMGSEKVYDSNKPVHEVTITKDFYMGKYEVTQAEYEKYCSYGSSSPSSTYGYGDNYPAYYVCWYDALVYCNKRSIAEGLTPCYSISGNTDPSKWGRVPTSSDSTWNAVVCDWNANGYRLPTEAEWEYAARAGDNTVSSLTWAGTNSSSNLGEYAWYSDNSIDKTHPVGTKKSNAFGLYDMSGNVWEWCWNWITSCYDTETEGGTNPTGTSSGDYRVLRGGSWRNVSDYCAVSFRNSYGPSRRNFYLGFRVVRASSN